MNELDLLDDVMEFLHELYNDPKVFMALDEEQLDRIGEFQDHYHIFEEMRGKGK